MNFNYNNYTIQCAEQIIQQNQQAIELQYDFSNDPQEGKVHIIPNEVNFNWDNEDEAKANFNINKISVKQNLLENTNTLILKDVNNKETQIVFDRENKKVKSNTLNANNKFDVWMGGHEMFVVSDNDSNYDLRFSIQDGYCYLFYVDSDFAYEFFTKFKLQEQNINIENDPTKVKDIRDLRTKWKLIKNNDKSKNNNQKSNNNNPEDIINNNLDSTTQNTIILAVVSILAILTIGLLTQNQNTKQQKF